jgi:hypothetical protein
MAQLRDKVTSEVVFEGDVEEVVLLAAKIGEDEVLFDGVGTKFNAQAVQDAYEERRETEKGKKQPVEARVQKALSKVNARLKDARALVED